MSGSCLLLSLGIEAVTLVLYKLWREDHQKKKNSEENVCQFFIKFNRNTLSSSQPVEYVANLLSSLNSLLIWYQTACKCWICLIYILGWSQLQAITALKKGAYLLKYGRRGKPKFCPFRLSNVSLALFSQTCVCNIWEVCYLSKN